MVSFHLSCKKKHTGAGREFVLDLDLRLEAGSFTAVMGPSGAGKTTLLRLFAGLEEPDSGIINAGDVVWFGTGKFVPARHRHIGYVFQDYALFPHMSVGRNIRFGFRAQEDLSWYDHLLRVFQLKDLENDKPASLSGGQQQRVALARAMAGRPQLLLLDEPMAALDFSLRNQLRGELKQITGELGLTVLLVTHDVLEAASLCSRVAWLEEGKMVKSGRPADVLREELRLMTAQLGSLEQVSGP